MNKVEIDKMLPRAYELLAENNIAQGGKIKKTYRGQISSFGAAIAGGSLLSAVAFFSSSGESTVNRPALMNCILELVKEKYKKENNNINAKNLFEYVRDNNDDKCKEDILNAALSLKLAMNLYELVKD